MKEGASDPFADTGSEPEPASESEDSDAAESAAEASDSTAAPTTPELEEHDRNQGRERAATDGEPARESGVRGDVEAQDAASESPDSEGVSVSREDLPYILARDNVKDQRPSVHQLFVRDETDRAAKDAERELESALGEDVYRLDAREAIYLAGIRNLDDAAAVLRRWGYDL